MELEIERGGQHVQVFYLGASLNAIFAQAGSRTSDCPKLGAWKISEIFEGCPPWSRRLHFLIAAWGGSIVNQ